VGHQGAEAQARLPAFSSGRFAACIVGGRARLPAFSSGRFAACIVGGRARLPAFSAGRFVGGRIGGRAMTAALHRAWAKDLDVPTLYALLKLRVEVFVVEQARPYPELDGRDLLAETRHFWLEAPDGEVICTLRLMEEHPGGHKAFRLGRLCTERSARGQGHTTRLLRAALAEVGDYPCRINAQIYLTDMYAQHGFVRDGDDFVDDGVPHVPMVRHGAGPVGGHGAGPVGQP
jgi:ElaA protein